jgi:hypothetical protein
MSIAPPGSAQLTESLRRWEKSGLMVRRD